MSLQSPMLGSLVRAGLRRFLRCQDGMISIECACIGGLSSIGIVGALSSMSGSVAGLFDRLSSTLSGSGGG